MQCASFSYCCQQTAYIRCPGNTLLALPGTVRRRHRNQHISEHHLQQYPSGNNLLECLHALVRQFTSAWETHIATAAVLWRSDDDGSDHRNFWSTRSSKLCNCCRAFKLSDIEPRHGDEIWTPLERSKAQRMVEADPRRACSGGSPVSYS